MLAGLLALTPLVLPAGTAVAGTGLAAAAPVAVTGTADPAGAARALHRQAGQAARSVDLLTARYRTARAAMDQARTALARASVLGVDVDARTDQARDRLRVARTRQVEAIRTLYAAGGGLGLVAATLTADDPTEAGWRWDATQQVLRASVVGGEREVQHSTAAVAGAAAASAQAQARALAAAAAVGDLRLARAEAAQSLAAATQVLARLGPKVRAADEAVAAAARLAAAQQQADRAARATSVRTAEGIPAEYLSAYRAAAGTCPGLRWSLLAALGQVESGHGRNMGPSSAGAMGPMQFMPATFAQVGVDGDGDGVRDIMDPQDAIVSAARYLCLSGLDASTQGTRRALFQYNHADWYVDLVLSTEQSILDAGAAATAPTP